MFTVSHNRSCNAQHQASGQVEELHSRQSNRIIGDFLIESFHFWTPVVARNGSENFERLLRLIVDAGGEERHSKRPPNQIHKRYPEVELVRERWLLTETREIGGKLSFGMSTPLTLNFAAAGRR